MYTLISEYGNVRCVTDKESKRDELLRLGYRLVEDVPTRKKRVSQSTAEAPRENACKTRKASPKTNEE